MGITFKENCPDIRNSKVIDIIKEFKDYDLNVDVYDPIADKIEVKNNMNEIPLGKQLKYALQEKEALKEDVKEWFNLTVEQQRQLSMDFARATAEVLELQYKLAEEVSIKQMIEQEEERMLAEEDLLRQQEWMNAMDVAYEQGIYK